ncbi:MAG: universal stress protein [Leptolyngbyaceae cyanobacterium CSU_1_4]|nr:universal stress protein [Leptolyngbyaceae cyanobacterium CSU_1_4]
MLQKILVALDCSETHQHVLDEALALAQATHASLMFFHVLNSFGQGHLYPVYPSADAYPALYEESIQLYSEQLWRLEEEGMAFLRSLAQQAAALDVSVECSQSRGDPGRMICQAAENWKADAILMGRRGRSGLREMLLGSVSNYVLHHAPCSVILIQGVLSDAEALQEYLDVC